jgi:hypothetical protein
LGTQGFAVEEEIEEFEAYWMALYIQPIIISKLVNHLMEMEREYQPFL